MRNRGHMSKSQKRAMRTLWPKYGLTIQYGTHLPLKASWNTYSSIVLEIGFGQGEHLLSRALNEPETLFLGVEVHKPAIANILKQIQTENIRIIRCDALALIHDHIPQKSLREVCIFFPEPWSEHNKHRRILNQQTLGALEPLLTREADLFFATDVQEYAHDVYTLLQNASHWSSSHAKYTPRPKWRPMSKYETKGVKEGRSIFDLHWQYTPSH